MESGEANGPALPSGRGLNGRVTKGNSLAIGNAGGGRKKSEATKIMEQILWGAENGDSCLVEHAGMQLRTLVLAGNLDAIKIVFNRAFGREPLEVKHSGGVDLIAMITQSRAALVKQVANESSNRSGPEDADGQ